jgi:hypothetical protein
MLKFLRKYNKWILVVAASFLMVAFLAPQAIQQWGQNQDKRVVARIGDDPVRLRDLRIANAEAQLAQLALPPGLLDERDKSAHWLLLTTEADRGGYVAGAGDGAALLDEMAQQIGYEMGFQQWMTERFEGIPQQFLSQIRDQVEQQWRAQWTGNAAMQQALTEQGRNYLIRQVPGPMTQQELYESLGRVRGVQRLFREWSQAGALSERRAMAAIKEFGRQAWGQAVFLPARDLAVQAPEPAEEEIQAHFERFNTVSPPEGQYGFGYTLPPRIKMQALVLDRRAIEEAITPDAIEVRKLWASQRQPDGPAFAEVRENVEAQVRGEVAAEVMDIARQAVGAALWPQIRQLDTEGAGGYRVVTDEYLASRPSLEDVAQAVKQRVAESSFPLASGGRVEIAAPVVRVYDRWLTPEDVSQLEVIGQAALQYAGGRVPLAQALLEVREIAGENNLGLQQHITPVQMPATTPDGSLVYYTVLDTRPQSPPDSMDEIREQVVDDLKALQAYEALQEELESYRALAIAEGLEAAAERFADARNAGGGDDPEAPRAAPPVTGEVRFTSQGAAQDGLPINELSHEVVLDAVLDVAEQLDPTSPLEELTAEQTLAAASVDKEMGVALVRILAPRPITQEQVRSNAMGLSRFVMERELGELGISENPFGFDALRKRLNYVDLDRRDGAADEEGGEDAETVEPEVG